MMRLLSLTVGRNEAYRYLYPMLMHASEIFDDSFFYDDQSDDRTVEFAEMANCTVVVRPDNRPSFIENEGQFRDDAWVAFENAIQPDLGDWILVIDCDEFLLSWEGADPRTVRSSLQKVVRAAENASAIAVDLHFDEVFGVAEGDCPLIRKDREWGKIHAPRLFTYRPDGRYFHGKFGVPAVPSYVQSGRWFSADTISIMHYGYAEVADQEAKYRRYDGQTGHGDDHVQSIMSPDKTLERWEGPYFAIRAAWTTLT
jgi:hypothetical protein